MSRADIARQIVEAISSNHQAKATRNISRRCAGNNGEASSSAQLASHPAALLARFWPDLASGLPEPERAGDGEPRRHIEPAPLQVQQQIAPVLRAVAGAIGKATSSLRLPAVAPIRYQDALLFVFEAGL
jgi:hypothetical protein